MDRVEGLEDIYGSNKGSKGGFGVVKVFDSLLYERTQQSEGLGIHVGLGRGKMDLVENESVRSWRGTE